MTSFRRLLSALLPLPRRRPARRPREVVTVSAPWALAARGVVVVLVKSRGGKPK